MRRHRILLTAAIATLWLAHPVSSSAGIQQPTADAYKPVDDSFTVPNDELRGLNHGQPRITGSLATAPSRTRIHVAVTSLVDSVGEMPADALQNQAQHTLAALLPECAFPDRITDADLAVQVITKAIIEESSPRIEYECMLLVWSRGQTAGPQGKAPIYTIVEREPTLEDALDHVVALFAREVKRPQ